MLTEVSRCRAMPVPFGRLGGWGDKAVGHGADAFDVGAEDLAGAKELGRMAGGTDARRGAGEDQVAGEQGQHRRKSSDEFGHAEDHLRSAALLDVATIDATTDIKIVRVREFVGCKEPRACRAKTGK